MTTPRVKRPFSGAASDPAQRQITTFFSRDEYEATASRSSPHESTTPRLPPTVQANLLAVGMRVRKSVPEGYKTSKEHDDPWATASHGAPRPSSSPWTPAAAMTPPRAGRELVPFCGLHKVGGLDVQSFGDDADRPLFSSSLFGGMDSADAFSSGDMSEPPSLTSSQDTVSSTDSSSSSSYSSANVFGPPSWSRRPSQPRRFSAPRWEATKTPMRNKRTYDVHEEDEDEDEDDLNGDTMRTDSERTLRVYDDTQDAPSSSSSINGWLTGSAPAWQATPITAMPPPPLPPSSRPSHHNSAPHYFQNGRRVLAVPRRRQPPQERAAPQEALGPEARCKPGRLVRDQENVDFDEADFLDATVLGDVRSGADMQMGGM